MNLAINKILGRGRAIKNEIRGVGGLIGGNGECNLLSVPTPSRLPEKESRPFSCLLLRAFLTGCPTVKSVFNRLHNDPPWSKLPLDAIGKPLAREEVDLWLDPSNTTVVLDAARAHLANSNAGAQGGFIRNEEVPSFAPDNLQIDIIKSEKSLAMGSVSKWADFSF